MKRINQVELIRIVAALGIICFHFACESASQHKLLYQFNQYNWGTIWVEVFFILSGGLLYYNNSEIESKKIFYLKRWKAIFPSFYIAYLVTLLFQICKMKTVHIFHVNNPLLYLLSFFGMDGYLYDIWPNAYLIGEWFLGAIILMYLLYPLVLLCMKKWVAPTTVLIVVGFVVEYIMMGQRRNPARNVFACLTAFYLGMLIFRYESLLKNKILLAACGLFMVFAAIWRNESVPQIVMEELIGFSVFILLFHLGNLTSRSQWIQRLCAFGGAISYPIFLLQHVVICNLLEIKNPTSRIGYLRMLGLVMVVTILLATLLNWITKCVMKSKYFKKMEMIMKS